MVGVTAWKNSLRSCSSLPLAMTESYISRSESEDVRRNSVVVLVPHRQQLPFRHAPPAARARVTGLPRLDRVPHGAAARTAKRDLRCLRVAGVLRGHDIEQLLALRTRDGTRRDCDPHVGPAGDDGLVPARVASKPRVLSHVVLLV